MNPLNVFVAIILVGLIIFAVAVGLFLAWLALMWLWQIPKKRDKS